MIFMQMGSRVVVGRDWEERETAIYCLMGAEFQSGMMIKFVLDPPVCECPQSHFNRVYEQSATSC